MIDVGHQQSPQLIYFGTDARIGRTLTLRGLPLEVLAGFFFFWFASCSSGRARRWAGGLPSLKPAAGVHRRYLGSLAGIAVFGLMSIFLACRPYLVSDRAFDSVLWFVPRRRVLALRWSARRPGRGRR